ncbi:MAG: hypothetical protein EB824_00915 [Thaumarchaeota archaeon S15]|nr:MAG: hypothetical protein EB833_06540 [Thaumarchaeota archaeon S13]RNJ76148.1 MAG: hypothetical protein EB824_00915 [Thaumarchaeota archaeon S15]
MGEYDEFAEALLDQLSVEVSEEREMERLAGEIAADADFGVSFEPLDELAERLLDGMAGLAEGVTGLARAAGLRVEVTGLGEFKSLKARKVHAREDSAGYARDLFAAVGSGDAGAVAGLAERDTPRFLVYSTYAKSYLSKISTTYGDYMEPAIHLNSFILSRYPQIILYRQGRPYEARRAAVSSGYVGAVKMTILEEATHSMQGPLHEANRAAVAGVNAINEELAAEIMGLGDAEARGLAEHLGLPPVPDDFAVALRANLFFALNPDNFVARVLGPDVMTYNRVEVEPGIARALPGLAGMYERWLRPIQAHHAAFAVMEGMAAFVVREALADDADFGMYLQTFMGTDRTSYGVRKGIGRDFVAAAHSEMGREAFGEMLRRAPTTRDIKDPAAWLAAAGH